MKFNDVIRKIKGLFAGGKKKRNKGAYPRKFAAVRFTSGASRNGLHGNRSKVIKQVENNREKTKQIPYQPEIRRAFRDVLSMPFHDETGGQDRPDKELLEQYRPNKIKWG